MFRRRTISERGKRRRVDVKLGDSISGDKKLIIMTKDRTRDNSLFLSAATQVDQKECSLVYNYIVTQIDTTHSGSRSDRWMLDFTSSMLADESVLMEDFLKFMKMADPSIANVMIEDEAANSAMLSKIIQEGMAPRKRPVFEHFSKTGTFKVALNQESKGLQRGLCRFHRNSTICIAYPQCHCDRRARSKHTPAYCQIYN